MKTLEEPAWARDLQPHLDTVLDALLPPGADGRLPGGASAGIPQSFDRDTSPAASAVLARFVDVARSFGSGDSRSVPADRWPEIVRCVRTADPAAFTVVVTQMLYVYYSDPLVIDAIGSESRAPFPDGYSVPDGDLSLLEAVYERGPIFRS